MKQRNFVHYALMRAAKRSEAHGKTHKAERRGKKVALRREIERLDLSERKGRDSFSIQAGAACLNRKTERNIPV